jgi:hypothetical protein
MRATEPKQGPTEFFLTKYLSATYCGTIIAPETLLSVYRKCSFLSHILASVTEFSHLDWRAVTRLWILVTALPVECLVTCELCEKKRLHLTCRYYVSIYVEQPRVIRKISVRTTIFGPRTVWSTWYTTIKQRNKQKIQEEGKGEKKR